MLVVRAAEDDEAQLREGSKGGRDDAVLDSAAVEERDVALPGELLHADLALVVRILDLHRRASSRYVVSARDVALGTARSVYET